MGSKGFPPSKQGGGKFPSNENNGEDIIFDRRKNRDSGGGSGRQKRKFDYEKDDKFKKRGSSGRKSDNVNIYETDESNNLYQNSMNGGNVSNNQDMMSQMSQNQMMMMSMMGVNPMMNNMNLQNMTGMPQNIPLPPNMGNMTGQNMGVMSQNMGNMNGQNMAAMNQQNMAAMNPQAMMMGQYPMMPMQPGQDNAMLGMLGAGLGVPPTVNFFASINTREPIPFSNFILYPPSPKAPPPTTRERPLGCKTIFVGGLPENFTDEQLQELFSKCGDIQNTRLSTKRFAHIRFMSEMSVDMALYFSGYRIRIEDKTDNPNTGRLHIDFAQARDDQYEYECQQRALDRERRHQHRLLTEQYRVPSPPTVVHYSDHEANTISEKIKGDETFEEALSVVCIWLERGDCNKKNATTFYTLLQSTNSHVRRLVSEKAMFDEEFQRARDMHAVQIAGIGKQYSTVEKVFVAASQKKVWDHFTKAQRKNIESWKKAAADIKILMPNETADMDTDSDSDEEKPKKKKNRMEDQNALKDENDSLRCQLDAYKNEVEVLKMELQSDLEVKEEQIKVSQKAIENMHKSIVDAKREENESARKVALLNKELLALRKKLKEAGVETGESTEKKVDVNNDDKKIDTSLVESIDPVLDAKISERDAKLIGLISIFLHIHPFGASVDYIWSYLQKFEPSVNVLEVENLMGKYSSIFMQDLFGIGANMERRWKYWGVVPASTQS